MNIKQIDSNIINNTNHNNLFKIPVCFHYTTSHQINKSINYRSPLLNRSQNQKNIQKSEQCQEKKRGYSFQRNIQLQLKKQQNSLKKFKTISNSTLKPSIKPISINLHNNNKCIQKNNQYSKPLCNLSVFDFNPNNTNKNNTNGNIKHYRNFNKIQNCRQNFDYFASKTTNLKNTNINPSNSINNKNKLQQINQTNTNTFQPFSTTYKPDWLSKQFPYFSLHPHSKHQPQQSKNFRITDVQPQIITNVNILKSALINTPQSSNDYRYSYMDDIQQDNEQLSQQLSLQNHIHPKNIHRNQQFIANQYPLNYHNDNNIINQFHTLPGNTQFQPNKLQKQSIIQDNNIIRNTSKINHQRKPSLQLDNHAITENSFHFSSPPTYPQINYGEDKWDRILKLRQTHFNQNKQLNQSQKQDKIPLTTLKTVLKHPYFATSAQSVNSSSLKSSILTNNNPLILPHQLQKHLHKNPQINYHKPSQHQQNKLHISSYSDHYQPLLQYSSTIQFNNINQQQQIDHQIPNINQIFHKIKNISLSHPNSQHHHLSNQANNNHINNQKINKKINKNIIQQIKPPNISDGNRCQLINLYSSDENEDNNYRIQKQLFQKFLKCQDIQWMLYYQNMVNHYQSICQNNHHFNQTIKIGDNQQSIQNHQIFGYYIQIWLKSMGFGEKSVKDMVIENIQLVFKGENNRQKTKTKQKNKILIENEKYEQEQSRKQKYNAIYTISQFLYSNMLFGCLPTNLQLIALLQLCKKGWNYFIILICRIIKIITKINKNNKNQYHDHQFNHISWNYTDSQVYQQMEHIIRKQI